MRSAVLIFLLATTGCMSARLALSPKWDPEVKPSYVDYTDYYLFGFIAGGGDEFNLQKICVDQKPYGLQRYRSAEDGLIALFTLGIYAPATLRVWCGD